MTSENDNEVVRCNNCRTVLNEAPSLQRSERTPCPSCGSLSRYHIRLADVRINVSPVESRVKAKRLGKGKPFIEQQAKHELFRETSEYHDVDRVIDREHNRYIEIIKDSKTGEVIRQCCELLSYHVGHGYAKHKGKKD
jgi:hypothetical protein